MAMPMSARESTGASLMPSPTKASFPLGDFSESSASTRATLSAGSSWVWTSSRPSSCATLSPTALASPVSMTVSCTPWAFRAAMASFASGFTSSEMTMWPGVDPVHRHMDGGAHVVAGVPLRRRCPPSACRCPRRPSCRPPGPARRGRTSSSTSPTREASSSLP